MTDSGTPRHRLFVERLLIVAAFAVLAWMLWEVRSLLVVIIGAVVFGVLLRSIADPISRFTGLGARATTAIAVLIVIGVLLAAGWLFGSQASAQFALLGQAIPHSWDALRERAAALPMGEQLLDAVTQGRDLPARLTSLFTMITGAATTLVLIAFGAGFLAAQPRLYLDGLVMLVPRGGRERLRQALDDTGRALRLWLLGQLISMVVVGVLTGVGLWLAGVPSPLALGLIAGLTEGIPYIGPIIGSVPGLLLALTAGPQTVFWALLVYLAVQQIEGNTLVPLIQHRMVSLPPALTLFWIVAAGMLFGVLGLIFAAPMLVVLYVMVKRLYIHEALGTPTTIPGAAEDSPS